MGKNNFALELRPLNAVERGETGARHVLSVIVADILALAPVEDADAQYQRGCAYSDGNGVRQDYEEAAKWFRKAAEQGNADAQRELGWCYHYGRGVPQNQEQTFHWSQKAAEQGDADAQYKVGWCYFIGFGVPKDREQAVHWLYKAAEQGNEAAYYPVARSCELGSGIPKDYCEAYKFYKLAAEGKDATAIEKMKVIETLLTVEEIIEGERRWREFKVTTRNIGI